MCQRSIGEVTFSCAAGAPGADTPGAFNALKASEGVHVVGVALP